MLLFPTLTPVRKNSGFTLIELLVVIAIIALLASIILVSLNGARNKGKDTRVVSDVNQIRNIFEISFINGLYPDVYFATINSTGAASFTSNGPDNGGTGGTTAQVAGNMGKVMSDINNNAGAYPTVYVHTNATTGNATTPNATAYSVWGKTSTGYYCVDSTGYVVTNTTNGSIPAATVTCS